MQQLLDWLDGKFTAVARSIDFTTVNAKIDAVGGLFTAIIPDIVLNIDSCPDRIYLSNSVDLDAIQLTYRTNTFDLYILYNADTLLKVNDAPVQYSRQLITSGAVYSAINSLEARITALEALN